MLTHHYDARENTPELWADYFPHPHQDVNKYDGGIGGAINPSDTKDAAKPAQKYE